MYTDIIYGRKRDACSPQCYEPVTRWLSALLRKAVFYVAKDGKTQCDMRPFAKQKTAYRKIRYKKIKNQYYSTWAGLTVATTYSEHVPTRNLPPQMPMPELM